MRRSILHAALISSFVALMAALEVPGRFERLSLHSCHASTDPAIPAPHERDRLGGRNVLRLFLSSSRGDPAPAAASATAALECHIQPVLSDSGRYSRLILLSGLTMLVQTGFAAAPIGWHVMLALGLVMTGVFVYIYVGLFPRLRRHCDAAAWPAAGAARTASVYWLQ